MTKAQRELLRKARHGLVPEAFHRDLEAAVKPEDSEPAIALFALAKQRYGWRFGTIYAATIFYYRGKGPSRKAAGEIQRCRWIMRRAEAFRAKARPA